MFNPELVRGVGRAHQLFKGSHLYATVPGSCNSNNVGYA